jgi:hypothetical protein
MRIWLIASLAVLASLANVVAAEHAAPERIINEFLAGLVTHEEGLWHWQKFFEVASHPRCVDANVMPHSPPKVAAVWGLAPASAA